MINSTKKSIAQDISSLTGMPISNSYELVNSINKAYNLTKFDFYLTITTNIIVILTCIIGISLLKKIKRYTKGIFQHIYGFENEYIIENRIDNKIFEKDEEREQKRIDELLQAEKEVEQKIKKIFNMKIGKEAIEYIILGILIAIIITLIYINLK